MDSALRVALVDAQLEMTDLRALDDARGDGERAALARELAARTPTPDVPHGELRWCEESPLWAALAPADRLIRSLEGLPEESLFVLDIDSALSDLSALVAQPALEIVRVGLAEGAPLGPLLSCPGLQRVRLEGAVDWEHPALTELEARGVFVDRPLDRGAASRPFGDVMLKLAVLDALAAQDRISLPELPPAIDPQRLDEGNLDRLLTIELEPSALAGLTHLRWEGGGHALQHLVYEDFHGEDETFFLRDLSGIDALSGLRALRVSPLSTLPVAQLEALRARGLEVVEADAAREGHAIEDTQVPAAETVVVFRPGDLPELICDVLPADAGPRRCLYFIARSKSPAIRALMDAVEEPPIDHVDEGMALVHRVGRLLGQCELLAELVNPEQGTGLPRYEGVYNMGFHTADADAVEARLRQAGCALVPATELLEELIVLRVHDADRAPASSAQLVYDEAGARVALPMRPSAEAGWFVAERPFPPAGPVDLVIDGDCARLERLSAPGCAFVQMKPRDVPTLLAEIDDAYRHLGADGLLPERAAADEEALRAAERVLGFTLPDALRAFLAHSTRPHPFDGNFIALELDGVVDRWRTMTERLEDGAFATRAEPPGVPALKPAWWDRLWVPFAEDSAGNLRCVDLEPGPDGIEGQIIGVEMQAGPASIEPPRPSFHAFLTDHLALLRAGKVRVEGGALEVDRYA